MTFCDVKVPTISVVQSRAFYKELYFSRTKERTERMRCAGVRRIHCWLRRFLLWVLRAMDYRGLLPRALHRTNPFHVSAGRNGRLSVDWRWRKVDRSSRTGPKSPPAAIYVKHLDREDVLRTMLLWCKNERIDVRDLGRVQRSQAGPYVILPIAGHPHPGAVRAMPRRIDIGSGHDD